MKYLLRGIMFKLADGAIGPYESNDEAAGTHSTDVAIMNCMSVIRFMHVDILSWGDQQMVLSAHICVIVGCTIVRIEVVG